MYIKFEISRLSRPSKLALNQKINGPYRVRTPLSPLMSPEKIAPGVAECGTMTLFKRAWRVARLSDIFEALNSNVFYRHQCSICQLNLRLGAASALLHTHQNG